jgi:threonine dehydrogenase-like Zn-dependent dehydrogenase
MQSSSLYTHNFFSASFCQELTEGRGVDVVVEALGNPVTFKQAVQSIRDGGRAVMVGLAAAGVTADVDISKLVRREVSSLPSPLSDFLATGWNN